MYIDKIICFGVYFRRENLFCKDDIHAFILPLIRPKGPTRLVSVLFASIAFAPSLLLLSITCSTWSEFSKRSDWAGTISVEGTDCGGVLFWWVSLREPWLLSWSPWVNINSSVRLYDCRDGNSGDFSLIAWIDDGLYDLGMNLRGCVGKHKATVKAPIVNAKRPTIDSTMCLFQYFLLLGYGASSVLSRRVSEDSAESGAELIGSLTITVCWEVLLDLIILGWPISFFTLSVAVSSEASRFRRVFKNDWDEFSSPTAKSNQTRDH